MGEFTLVGSDLLALEMACLVASFEAPAEESREMLAGAATALGLTDLREHPVDCEA